MVKPYVKIRVNLDDSISAYLIVPGKNPKKLNANRVEKVLDKYSDMSHFRFDGHRTFYTDDSDIIHEFLSKKVTLKKAGIAIGVGVLLASFLNPFTFNTSKNTLSETQSPTEKVQNVEIISEDSLKNNGVLAVGTMLKSGKITNLSSNKTTDATENKTEEKIEITEPVFSFNYEDRSSKENLQYVIDNYSSYIKNYTEAFGIDYAGFTALVALENPYNKTPRSEYSARGVTQIENVWWGSDIIAYNYQKQDYEKVCIDSNKLVSDPEYAIKIGCMILNQYYENLYNSYVETGVLTKDECIVASYTAYNKGLYAVKKIINIYGSDYINHRDEAPNGDDLYIEHVFSYLDDGTMLTFKNTDGTSCSVYVNNEQTPKFTP